VEVIMPAIALFLQDTVEVGSFPDPWLLVVIAAIFIGAIVYLVKRIGPGGPWASR
jgi:hypothetical protein